LGADFRWNFLREGEPRVFIKDGLVTIRAAYRGDIEARTGARGCRLDPIYPTLDASGQLEIRQQDEHLVFGLVDPRVSIGLAPESDTKCNMFSVPVKDELRELMDQETIKHQITQAVNSGGFRIPIHQVWEQLHGPLAVSIVPFNTQLCVYGKPTEMTIGSLKGGMEHTTVSGVASERPTAMYENMCRKPTPTPVKVGSGAATADGQPFRILASVPIPYPMLTQALQDKLFHQEVALDTTFGDKLVIERATAADTDGRVMITLQSSGNLNGPIHYWGTPKLEDNGATVTVPDIQMTNESKKALDTIKVGYWQLVDKEINHRVRKAATVDLSQRVDAMKTAMSGQHRNGNLTMEIQVVRQQPERVYSTPQAVVADILLEGTASAAGRLTVEGTQERAKPAAPRTSHP
jgi:hypothetical protein